MMMKANLIEVFVDAAFVFSSYRECTSVGAKSSSVLDTIVYRGDPTDCGIGIMMSMGARGVVLCRAEGECFTNRAI